MSINDEIIKKGTLDILLTLRNKFPKDKSIIENLKNRVIVLNEIESKYLRLLLRKLN